MQGRWRKYQSLRSAVLAFERAGVEPEETWTEETWKPPGRGHLSTRLWKARSRAISLEGAHRETGISQERLVEFEAGEKKPYARELDALKKVCVVPGPPPGKFRVQTKYCDHVGWCGGAGSESACMTCRGDL